MKSNAIIFPIDLESKAYFGVFNVTEICSSSTAKVEIEFFLLLHGVADAELKNSSLNLARRGTAAVSL